ncbi:hypothetical protein HMPREF9103_01281 [Lentilactobacillus parafarraginis F0439]|uniref:Uncharacterized protein n=1 Tax=Lentilactobacillus parafarraginis F0439 TaxID=797515 RepID=G9ZNH8_9LACO|nr:hypothetical protein HMPREF9103_01281 [Lentilactobacillus parafarraginis F0439]
MKISLPLLNQFAKTVAGPIDQRIPTFTATYCWDLLNEKFVHSYKTRQIFLENRPILIALKSSILEGEKTTATSKEADLMMTNKLLIWLIMIIGTLIFLSVKGSLKQSIKLITQFLTVKLLRRH